MRDRLAFVGGLIASFQRTGVRHRIYPGADIRAAAASRSS